MTTPSADRLGNEIEHGRFLLQRGAGDVWNWEPPAGKLRWARRVRLLTHAVTPRLRVLELGCGTGYFTKELARTRARVAAIDISPDLLAAARSALPEGSVAFENMSAHELGFRDCSFDAVVGSSVLHHLDVPSTLREVFRVLCPGGFVVFTEPNMTNPQIALRKNISWLKRRLGDSPDETAFFRWSIRYRLERAGFTHVSAVPFDFLHPQIPAAILPIMIPVCALLERIPLVREIAGSLHITATRPVSTT